MKNEKISAFPGKNFTENGYPNGHNMGMELRDYFAAHVAANHMQMNETNINSYQAEATARWAYMVADAMLAARDK